MRFIVFFLGAGLLLGACVPNRKIVYVQKDDVNRHVNPKDSVFRSYALPEFEYRVQPNDALMIRFESITEREYDFLTDWNAGPGGGGGQLLVVNSELVDRRGDVSFPVVGKVRVAGLTVFEIQDTLQYLASQFLTAPVVKVRLVNFRFTVLGEVNQEGTIVSLNNRVSILEAIGLAGGMGELADRANVKLIRQFADKSEVIYLNLLDEQLLASPYYFLTQNDVLIVPALRQRPFRRYFGQNFGIVASTITSTVTLVVLMINLYNN